MTELERLIELLKPYMDMLPCENESGSCEFVHCQECRGRELAEKLIENGVILPPCKIGDEVYRISKRYGCWVVLPRYVSNFTYRGGNWWDVFTTTTDMLGSTVFLTYEEAEAEIQRRTRK